MRDPLKGEASVQDSLASGGPQSFFVRQKDEVDTDTLTLDWKREVPSGDYVMDFRVWDRPRARQLIARKFDAAADTAHRVGLITALQGSPVAEALRRLHVPTVALDSGAVHALGLGELGTIIIDRDALALRHDCSSWIPAIGSWVRSGGHLIVLPQYEAAGQGEAFAEGISFAGRPHMESTEPVETDPSSPMLTIPNRISAVDWQGWVVSVRSNQERNRTSRCGPFPWHGRRAPGECTAREGERDVRCPRSLVAASERPPGVLPPACEPCESAVEYKGSGTRRTFGGMSHEGLTGVTVYGGTRFVRSTACACSHHSAVRRGRMTRSCRRSTQQRTLPDDSCRVPGIPGWSVRGIRSP